MNNLISYKIYIHISNWPKFESILSSNKKNIANYGASFHFQVMQSRDSDSLPLLDLNYSPLSALNEANLGLH
jgi:hypothetical protein